MIQLIKKQIEKSPFISALVLCFLLFAVVTFFFPLPLSTDDFCWLADRFRPEGLSFSNFSSYIARLPVWVMFTVALFHLPGAENVWFPALLSFGLYLAGSALIYRYVLRRAPSGLHSSLVFFGSLVFFLYPTHYEVLYWMTCMNYVPGLFMWALSLYTPWVWLSTLLLAASFLTGEMFVLPAFILPIMVQILEGNDSLKDKVRPVLIWIGAITIFFLSRRIMTYEMGLQAFQYDIVVDPFFWLVQIKNAAALVFTLHFYKIYWVETLPYLLLLLFLGFKVLWTGKLSWRRFSLVWSLAFSTTAIYWVYGHAAPRALFGAQVLICALILFCASLLEWRISKKILTGFLVFFLMLSSVIFRTKYASHQELVRLESLYLEKMKSCQSPCEIRVENLNQGIKDDWILDHDFWFDFMNYVKNHNHIEKEIHFNII